jgi:hypothetical protein
MMETWSRALSLLLFTHSRLCTAAFDEQDDDEDDVGEGLGMGEAGRSKAKVEEAAGATDIADGGRGRGGRSEGWVAPKGQTGDGRTALNDKLGY